MSTNCRVIAAGIVNAVATGRGSLASLLPAAQVQEKDRALLQELCYGTLRHYFSLDQYLQGFLEKPLKEKDRDIHALLMIGSYQLVHTRIPAYAAIDSCVEGTQELHKPWAKGLVNAVLRNVQRSLPGNSPISSAHNDEALYDHPRWLIDAISRDWPGQATDVLETNNTRAPMTLRINTQRTTRSNYAALLATQQMAARPGELSDQALILEAPVNVEQLPHFSDGYASVQDEAAQLCAPLLKPVNGCRVLDCCAAPGGKTCHLLETVPDLDITAVDVDKERTGRVLENLLRLGLSANVLVADALKPESWWKKGCGEKPFARILVDAPCSATGVIRHHPDIKLLRKPTDIPVLAHTQLGLLRALWPLLEPGGILLYVTCSILCQENDDVVSCFLAETTDAIPDPVEADWGIPTQHGRQLLPQKQGHDGFYFSRIRKSGNQ